MAHHVLKAACCGDVSGDEIFGFGGRKLDEERDVQILRDTGQWESVEKKLDNLTWITSLDLRKRRRALLPPRRHGLWVVKGTLSGGIA